MGFRGRDRSRSGAVGSLRRGIRETRRKAFCYVLALSTSPPTAPGTTRESLAVRASKVVPFSRSLRQLIRRRPRARTVHTGQLLVGAQGGHDAIAFAEAIGTLRYGSTTMAASPHVELLRTAIDRGSELSDGELRDAEYWTFGHLVLGLDGAWFGARDDEEFLRVTRNFIEWAQGRSERVTGPGGTPFEDKILVAPISGSPMLQVIDGHHRVAAAIARGDATIEVHRTWLPTETPLHRRLYELNELQHKARSLRQPLPTRDVADGWTVTSNCADRLARMRRFLDQDLPERQPPHTYLDVGSSYGWFVAEMKRLGHPVLGIESDARAVDIGTTFYGLAADDVLVGDLTERVEELTRPYDVVTCFELLGAFRGGSRLAEPGRLVKAIDRIAGHVLFVDADEHPVRAAFPPDESRDSSLTRLVLDNTSFRRAVDLGANHDPVGARSAHSQSRLIAFVR